MMKIRMIVTVFVCSIFSYNISCHSQTKSKSQVVDCQAIFKLKFINRTQNKYILDTAIITERMSIDGLCSILSNGITVVRPKLQTYHGHVEIELYDKEGNSSSVLVFYTIYEGVIIRTPDGQFLKEDEIHNYLLKNMSKEKKKGKASEI